ncbi:MAG: hypothetical protein AAF570_04695, partial [Bacteroidota bacterium]
MKNFWILLATLFAFQILPAQESKTPPCSSPEYRQFDFWVGDWNVYSDGELVGTNRIDLILDQCVLQENWEGKGGSKGKSFNLYNGQTKMWEQTWVDNHGGVLVFRGEYKDRVLAMAGEGKARDG